MYCSNALHELSNKVCIPNKTENLNLSMFNMITGIDEFKTLTKHISCECKCKFDGRKYNSEQWWNNDKCWCECKKCHVCEKGYVWNLATCSYENGYYLESFLDDSAIICDKVIDVEADGKSDDTGKSYDEETERVPTNFNEKKAACKTQDFYVLLAIL